MGPRKTAEVSTGDLDGVMQRRPLVGIDKCALSGFMATCWG
jgi:hypothetical protein